MMIGSWKANWDQVPHGPGKEEYPLLGSPKGSRITVNYRLSKPGEPMPSVLPQGYDGRIVRIPTTLNTIGDHIRRRRLGLKLMQNEAAEQIGVTQCCIFKWEANTSNPHIEYMPTIIRLLGYDPLSPANTWGERLVRHRTALGLTQREAAKRIFVAQVEAFLGNDVRVQSCERIARDGPTNGRG